MVSASRTDQTETLGKRVFPGRGVQEGASAALLIDGEFRGSRDSELRLGHRVRRNEGRGREQIVITLRLRWGFFTLLNKFGPGPLSLRPL
jgi:hypothetical protein